MARGIQTIAGWRRWTLPLLWIGAAALVLITTLVGALARGWAGHHYFLSLIVWFTAFAAIYALLTAVHAPFRRWLGYVHFGLVIAGVGLIFAPGTLLMSGVPIASDDSMASLRLLSEIVSAGYLISLTGLLAFASLLVDLAATLIRRRR